MSIGDATSISSSDKSDSEKDNDIEIKGRNSDTKISNNTTNTKYKSFVQVFLKVKFEKLHNTNAAQFVEPTEIFKEVVKQNVNQEDWRDFIIEELKHPNIYIERSKLEKEKEKRKALGMK